MTVSPGLIEPETKDWTFVLQDGCAECGCERAFLAGRPSSPGPQPATGPDRRFGRPSSTAATSATSAGSSAALFDTVRPDQYERPGRRSNGSVFTVESFGRYFLHDIEHHLVDVAG